MNNIWRHLPFAKRGVTGTRAVMDCKLVHKKNLTQGVRNPVVLFRFELPHDNTLQNPILSAVSVAVEINGVHEWRNYTPITHHATKGYFEIMVKVYPEGVVGNYLLNLDVGKTISVSAPKWKREHELGKYDHVGIIAGGVGLAPMIQLIERTLNESPNTKISILFANQTEQDIIFYDRMKEWAQKYPQFEFNAILSQPHTEWTGLRGHVNDEMIRTHMPHPSSNSLVVYCGPKPLNKKVKQILETEGYTFHKA
jgi:cytochrome-b5 reductase